MKQLISACILSLVSHAVVFAAAPTQSSSNLQAQHREGDKLTLTFTKGNGAYRIVVVQEGAPVAELPANGVDYTANAAFGTRGTEFTAAEGYVVYRGNSAAPTTTITVTNLKPGTTYYVSVFEFNGKSTRAEYLMTPLSGKAILNASIVQQETADELIAAVQTMQQAMIKLVGLHKQFLSYFRESRAA